MLNVELAIAMQRHIQLQGIKWSRYELPSPPCTEHANFVYYAANYLTGNFIDRITTTTENRMGGDSQTSNSMGTDNNHEPADEAAKRA